MNVALESHLQPARADTTAARLLFRLENVPMSGWHTRVRVIMGTATFFDAFDALSLAFVLPVLVKLWQLSPGEVGALIAAGYLGQVLGAMLFGTLAERIGRVPAVSIAVGVMSIMSIACAFSTSFVVLFALRLVQGIGVGGEVPIAASYINELSQSKGRGRFFLLYELIFPLGLLGAAQVGAFVVPRFGWEFMFLIGGVPGLVILFFLARLPESPRWLISKGRLDAAERIVGAVEASTPQRTLDAGREAAAIEGRVAAIAEGMRTRQKTSWKELFSVFYRPRTLTVWALWALSYFVANGINNWLPTLYSTVYHLPLQQALRLASVTNVLSTCAVLACALMVDRVGRRRWAMASFAVSGTLLLALALIGAGSPWSVGVLASCAYAVMGTTTVLLYLYTPEIYPTRMRAIGTGLATSWLRLASALAPAAVGFVLTKQGIAMVFAMFAVANLLGLVVARHMVETTDRALEELSP